MRDRFARVVSAAYDTISDTGFDVCQCDITLEHIQTGIEHSIARWLALTCAAPVPWTQFCHARMLLVRSKC
jgi:hypothetical protein